MKEIILYQNNSGWDWLRDAIREYNDCFMCDVALESIYTTRYVKEDSVFIGSLDKSKLILKSAHNIDYSFNSLPNHSEEWIYGRKIEIQNIDSLNVGNGKFVRSINPKEFPAQRVYGSVVKNYQGLPNIESGKAYVSDIIPNILSEWRFYVGERQNSQLLEYKHAATYVGDPKVVPNQDFLSNLLATLNGGMRYLLPCAFSVDIGVTKDKTFVIEFNDFIALGNYGLDGATYIDLAIKRWSELTNA